MRLWSHGTRCFYAGETPIASARTMPVVSALRMTTAAEEGSRLKVPRRTHSPVFCVSSSKTVVVPAEVMMSKGTLVAAEPKLILGQRAKSW